MHNIIAAWEYFLETLDTYGGNLVFLSLLLILITLLMVVNATYGFSWGFIEESWWLVLGAMIQALKGNLSDKKNKQPINHENHKHTSITTPTGN